MNEVFFEYAKYYNLLNRQKDYKSEIKFILDKISPNVNLENVLDIGCGSGILYPYLKVVFKDYYGIDLSKDFIEIARSTYGNHFHIADMRTFNYEKTYDLVISLFHVVNYVNNIEELQDLFTNVCRSLKDKSSFFVFDTWDLPSVKKIGLSETHRVYEDDSLIINRWAKSKWVEDGSRVAVNFNFEVRTDDKARTFDEKHLMRPFSFSEISSAAKINGLQIVSHHSFPDHSIPIDELSWGKIYFIQKI
jgi:predicted TPR repeat methyltransferase